MSAVQQHPCAIELVERAKLRGDPDLEPKNGGSQEADRNLATADAEADAGDEPEIEDEHADRADYEPSLGAPERHHDQRRWAAGAHNDAELVDEDGEAVHAD